MKNSSFEQLIVVGCVYTSNDWLKADVLTMMILNAGGVPLDNFIAWRKAESKALYGLFKRRFEYDEQEFPQFFQAYIDNEFKWVSLNFLRGVC